MSPELGLTVRSHPAYAACGLPKYIAQKLLAPGADPFGAPQPAADACHIARVLAQYIARFEEAANEDLFGQKGRVDES